MFGFFRRRLLREHAKLVCQNYLADQYLSGYFEKQGLNIYSEDIQNIMDRWRYGERLQSPDLKQMLHINSQFRRMYSLSLGVAISPFDEEFKPKMGWDWFYELEGIK